MTARDTELSNDTEDVDLEASFPQVFGPAIDIAVRRAIDRIGRTPLGELDPATERADTSEPPPIPDPRPWDGQLNRRWTDVPVADGDGAGAGRDPFDTRDTRATRAPLGLPKRRTEGMNPYALLGLKPSATWEQITAAYRRRARAWHPDGADPDEVDRRHELIRQLNAAYAELRAQRARSLP